jgi:hypothetical protein
MQDKFDEPGSEAEPERNKSQDHVRISQCWVMAPSAKPSPRTANECFVRFGKLLLRKEIFYNIFALILWIKGSRDRDCVDTSRFRYI